MQQGYFQPWVPPQTAFSLEDSLKMYRGGLIDTRTLTSQAAITGEKGFLATLSQDKNVQLLLDVIQVVPAGAVIVLAVRGALWLWDVISEKWPALAECLNGMVDFLVDAVEWTWENVRLTIEGLIYTIADWFDGWFDSAREAGESAAASAQQALEQAKSELGGYGDQIPPLGYWTQDEYEQAQEDAEDAEAAANDAWAQGQIAQDNAEAQAEDEFGDPVEEDEDEAWEGDSWDYDPTADMTDADWEDLEDLYGAENWDWDQDFMDPGEDYSDAGW